MAVLLQFNLTSDFTATTTAAGITTGAVTDQSGSLTSFTQGTTGSYATNPISSVFPASGATNAATAITTNSFFFTTINPLSGKSFSLTSLTIDMAKGGASGTRGYDIRSDVDNYAASLGTANLTAVRSTFETITIDLSAASFQTSTAPITFRFYIFTPSTGQSVDWDTLTINGTTADSGTVEQEGFRWRNDDGSETTATWLAAQDTTIIQPINTNTRIRVILNSTLDRGSESFRVEVREVGGTTYLPIS